MACALNVRGLMNVQFAIEEPHSDDAAHLRAGGQSARQPHGAVRRQDHRRAGGGDRRQGDGRREARRASTWPTTPYDHIAVKEAVFPFARFPGVDTVLGPEMRSTGEVMGLDWRARRARAMAPAFARAFAKSQLGGGTVLPQAGCVFVSVQGRRQALDRRAGAPAGRARLPHHRHRRHLRATCASRASRSSWSRRCWRAARTSSTR